MDIGKQKRTLRQQASRERDRINRQARHGAGQAVAKRVGKLAAYAEAGTVLIYLSFGSELPTAALVSKIRADGKRLVVPKVVGDVLTLHPIDHPDTDTAPGKWGIPEPLPTCPTLPAEQIDLFLLPGLAFDASGGRLGYGRGFFDRVLAHTGGTRIGIGFDGQIVPSVPVAAWDIPLHWIMTPGATVKCTGNDII